eukprot:9666655-Prorocentrum_lima.AAC.1
MACCSPRSPFRRPLALPRVIWDRCTVALAFQSSNSCLEYRRSAAHECASQRTFTLLPCPRGTPLQTHSVALSRKLGLKK